MEPKSLNIKISKGENEHILNLKSSFDHRETLVDHAIRYLNLGWDLLAIDVETWKDLDLGFQDVGTYINRLEDPSVDATRINLAVHIGSLSRLMVLEIANEEQRSCLDEWGEWRSHCVAELGPGLEKHFYLQPSDFQAPPTKMPFYVEGISTLPPSQDPLTQERWRWQSAPWDSPPPPVPLAILDYLNGMRGPTATGTHLRNEPQLSWQKLYCLISPFEAVLQAFSQGGASMDDYYGKLLRVALEAGLTDADLLLSLLWHAPLGDARQRPERWANLEKLVGQVRLEESLHSPKFPEYNRTICSVKVHSLNFREQGMVERQPISRRAIKNG